MEYRLVSVECPREQRSMLSLKIVREIEAIKGGTRLKRMWKDGDDVRRIVFTDGMRFRLLFQGEKCILESPIGLSTFGIAPCNSVGELFETPNESGKVKRFSFGGFIYRVFVAFRKTKD